jgi:hypothetical protein
MTPNGRGVSPVSGVTLPGWDPNHVGGLTGDSIVRGEAAVNDFLSNPDKYVELYADPDKWNASDEVTALDTFAQYSDLHTTAAAMVQDYVANAFEGDALENLETARTANSLISDPNSKQIVNVATIVYIAREGGRITYVRITDNFARRAAEHRLTGRTIQQIGNLASRTDARNVEQALIVKHNPRDNLINSTSPRREDYSTRLQRGQKLLKGLLAPSRGSDKNK